MDEQLITSLANEIALKLGGITFIIVSLIGFLATVYINREREKDRKNSEKSIHVYKAQFEKEFSSYQELWNHINDTHFKIGVYYRSIKFNENIEKNRQESKKSLYATQKVANELVPFIYGPIEKMAFELLDIYGEIHLAACVYLDGNRPEDLEMIGKTKEVDFDALIDLYENRYDKTCRSKIEKITVAIRKRLASLNVT